jgi:hypothetical protein
MSRVSKLNHGETQNSKISSVILRALRVQEFPVHSNSGSWHQRNYPSLFPSQRFRLILKFPGKTQVNVPVLSLPIIPLHNYALVLGGSAALIAAYYLLRRKPKSLDEIERGRREWLDNVGRITDGTVIDVQEMRENGDKPATFLIYQYDVAGVSYEASQDVTYLRQRINLHSCRLGLPTSVRYDPQNPGNSIVLSEKWMGLRQ